MSDFLVIVLAVIACFAVIPAAIFFVALCWVASSRAFDWIIRKLRWYV